MSTNSKTACLTIDDAPSVDMSWKVEYLSQRGIPAIWFCRGNRHKVNNV